MRLHHQMKCNLSSNICTCRKSIKLRHTIENLKKNILTSIYCTCVCGKATTCENSHDNLLFFFKLISDLMCVWLNNINFKILYIILTAKTRLNRGEWCILMLFLRSEYLLSVILIIILSQLLFMYEYVNNDKFIWMLAFMCHHNTFLVYQSMQNASLELWQHVTHISVGFALIISALFGLAGYATFRALSQGTYVHMCVCVYEMNIQ